MNIKESIGSFILNLQYNWQTQLQRILILLLLAWPVAELVKGHTINFLFRPCGEPSLLWLYALAKIGLIVGIVWARDYKLARVGISVQAGLLHHELPYGWDDPYNQKMRWYQNLAIISGLCLAIQLIFAGGSC